MRNRKIRSLLRNQEGNATTQPALQQEPKEALFYDNLSQLIYDTTNFK